MKVAQAVKQAMGLMLNRLETLIDQRLADKSKHEASKNIALEQRITNRIHELIRGEIAVRMME